jgi:hypothetical protein
LYRTQVGIEMERQALQEAAERDAEHERARSRR